VVGVVAALRVRCCTAVLECVATKANIRKPNATGGEVHVLSDSYDAVREALVKCDPNGLIAGVADPGRARLPRYELDRNHHGYGVHIGHDQAVPGREELVLTVSCTFSSATSNGPPCRAAT
jgi:hypothetical protein